LRPLSADPRSDGHAGGAGDPGPPRRGARLRLGRDRRPHRLPGGDQAGSGRLTVGDRLAPSELGRRLDRILAASEQLIAEAPESRLDFKPPPRDRTLRDLAYHVFRLSLA